ncbi:precorrin-2 dehydrogenase / sirohydrochlorin ferrochelatase [Candidatus Magnetomoraceae bacterium gMMP-15]
MRYYPVNLNIKDKKCLVIGGGPVSARKVKTLIKCKAYLIVVSPEIHKDIIKLACENKIILKKRPYKTSDLNSVFLVIAATNNPKLNKKIGEDAALRQILCNIVDMPEQGNFVLPSIVQSGDLMLAISTSGKSPALAKRLRQRLEKEFGQEYEVLLNLMGAVRKKLLSLNHAPHRHKKIFNKLLDEGLLEMIQEHRKDDIDELLVNTIGQDYTLKELGSV